MKLDEITDFERHWINKSFTEKGQVASSVDRHSTNPTKSIMTFLTDKGFELLGKGSYATVFHHKSRPYAVKVAHTPDRAYKAYATFCKANYQRNPMLPQIFDIWTYGDYFLCVMEKLQKVDIYNAELVNRVEMIDNYLRTLSNFARFPTTKRAGPLTYFLTNYPVFKPYKDFLDDHTEFLMQIAGLIVKEDLSMDLHVDNFMMRGTQIVLTDPVD